MFQGVPCPESSDQHCAIPKALSIFPTSQETARFLVQMKSFQTSWASGLAQRAQASADHVPALALLATGHSFKLISLHHLSSWDSVGLVSPSPAKCIATIICWMVWQILTPGQPQVLQPRGAHLWHFITELGIVQPWSISS